MSQSIFLFLLDDSRNGHRHCGVAPERGLFRFSVSAAETVCVPSPSLCLSFNESFHCDIVISSSEHVEWLHESLLARSALLVFPGIPSSLSYIVVYNPADQSVSVCSPSHVLQWPFSPPLTPREHFRCKSKGLGCLFTNNVQIRSEERRVGKECRSRWSPYH